MSSCPSLLNEKAELRYSATTCRWSLGSFLTNCSRTLGSASFSHCTSSLARSREGGGEEGWARAKKTTHSPIRAHSRSFPLVAHLAVKADELVRAGEEVGLSEGCVPAVSVAGVETRGEGGEVQRYGGEAERISAELLSSRGSARLTASAAAYHYSAPPCR